MLDVIIHHLQITLPQGLISLVKGIFLKGTCLYAFMCIPLEIPFLDSLFLYVRNRKITAIEYSYDMEGFTFIFKWMLFIVYKNLHNDYRVESYALS